MTKYKLAVDQGYDFVCFGVSSHLKDFRVAWHMNRLKQFSFKRQSLTTQTRLGEQVEYAVFKNDDEKNHLRYFLVNNRSEAIPLVKEYRQFNLLILVEGFVDIFDADRFIDEMQQLDAIQLITTLPKEPIERFQYDLFEQ
ncbi:MAG: hypothetical protein Salg2KO_09000 [Salibacteraceae bacterium]